MPVFCDEGVVSHGCRYSESDTFTADINGMFVGFHYGKILPRCNGCYTSGSGHDDDVIEAEECFRKRILISILTESHY